MTEIIKQRRNLVKVPVIYAFTLNTINPNGTADVIDNLVQEYGWARRDVTKGSKMARKW